MTPAWKVLNQRLEAVLTALHQSDVKESAAKYDSSTWAKHRAQSRRLGKEARYLGELLQEVEAAEEAAAEEAGASAR